MEMEKYSLNVYVLMSETSFKDRIFFRKTYFKSKLFNFAVRTRTTTTRKEKDG